MRFSRASLTCRPAALGLMAAAFLCVLLGGRDAAVAQIDVLEADKEVLKNYQLTIPKIDKLEAVARKLVTAAKADPQIRKELEAIEAEKDTPIDAITDKFNKLAPHLTAVLKAEGTDPHEFYVGLLSAMLASIAAEFAGTPSSDAVPDFVPAGNIAFVKKHKPRLDLLEKELSEVEKVDQAE